MNFYFRVLSKKTHPLRDYKTPNNNIQNQIIHLLETTQDVNKEKKEITIKNSIQYITYTLSLSVCPMLSPSILQEQIYCDRKSSEACLHHLTILNLGFYTY